MKLNHTKIFQGTDQEKDIFLDFEGESIKSLKINGEDIAADQIKFDRHMISLDSEKLKVGDDENTIDIEFTNTYVNNSAGLHRYQDPEDKEIYLYTHLEPYFCHRWFPCFD